MHTDTDGCTRMHTDAHGCTRMHTHAHARTHAHAHIRSHTLTLRVKVSQLTFVVDWLRYNGIERLSELVTVETTFRTGYEHLETQPHHVEVEVGNFGFVESYPKRIDVVNVDAVVQGRLDLLSADALDSQVGKPVRRQQARLITAHGGTNNWKKIHFEINRLSELL